MIPLCCRDNINFEDNDGTVWLFAPMTGRLEREVIEFTRDFQGYGNNDSDDSKLISRLNSLVLKTVISCYPKSNPSFFNDKNLVDELTINEKVNVIYKIWNKANTVSTEEKKS